MIARRSDTESLKTAAQIAVIAGEVDAAKSFCQRYVQECQLKFNWQAASQVLKLHSSFKVA